MPYLTIEGLTPLTFGTGKAFEAGASGALDAETRPMPLPTTLAGAIRNELARSVGWMEYSNERRDALNEVRVRGPLAALDGSLLFEAPSDCVTIATDGGSVRASLRPASGHGALLPEGMRPTKLPLGVDEPGKGEGMPYWDAKSVTEWLVEPKSLVWRSGARGHGAIPIESRLHVSIDSARRANRRGHFFATQGAAFGTLLEAASPVTPSGQKAALLNRLIGARTIPDVKASELALACEYEAEGDLAEPRIDVLTLGGYRGLALASECKVDGWSCPDGISKALEGAKRVRLQLATPGAFAEGWRPSLAALKNKGIELRLVSACIGRRQPGAGWLTHGSSQGSNLRSNRWLVPAGSVYFFEVTSGNAALLADAWLESVADDEQDRRDGFALALWGIWGHREDA